MWSLPDIKRLNEEAVSNKAKLTRAAKTGRLDREKLQCEWFGHSEPCEGELRHYLWYDIFSDDPKGILTLCERHDGRYGSPSEGYFSCGSCQRVMIENYTWELYYANDEEDGQVCLPCLAKKVIANQENWTRLQKRVIAKLTFDDVRKAPHCIGVSMPVPKEIKFFKNVELDSTTGGRLTGFSSSERSPEGGVQELKEILNELREQKHKRAILILDAAYQFSISIGVYVDA